MKQALQRSYKSFSIVWVMLLLAVLVTPQVRIHAASETLNVTAVVVDENAVPGGGGISTGTVVISGNTFPNAKLTLLKDGVVATTLVVGNDGLFQITINNLNLGNYQFSVYAEDGNGIQSAPYTTNANVNATTPFVFSGVLLPPTLSFASTIVSDQENLKAYGYSAPGSLVSLELPGSGSLAAAVANSNGYYEIFRAANLNTGTYLFRTKAKLGDVASLYSKPVQVLIYKGMPIPNQPGVPPVKPPLQLASCGDFNKDKRINLIDFSILLFWFGKQNPPSSVDCNSDKLIDIKDFSILMYFWTG